VTRFPLRPAVHAALLPAVLLLPAIGGTGMAAVAGAAALANLVVLPRTPFGRALRREGEPLLGGLVTYPLAVMLGFLLFPPVAAAGGWAALAVGDPAAAWAGRRAGGRAPLPWNPRKSWAGSAAFAAAAGAGILATLAALAALGTWPGIDPLRLPGDAPLLALGFAASGALAGAVAESLDLGLDDNLPVLLGTGGTLALLAGG